MIEKQLRLQDSQIRTALRLYGSDYTFTKTLSAENDFGEPTEGIPEIVTLRGLFHTERNYVNINITISDSGAVKSKDLPMILCSYEQGKSLGPGFRIQINQTDYEVKAVTDIGQYHKWIDVSLGAIENGSEQF